MLKRYLYPHVYCNAIPCLRNENNLSVHQQMNGLKSDMIYTDIEYYGVIQRNNPIICNKMDKLTERS